MNENVFSSVDNENETINIDNPTSDSCSIIETNCIIIGYWIKIKHVIGVVTVSIIILNTDKIQNKKFYTYGCFCSLECAAAYNFSEEKNVQDIWECYNLINLFSQTINYKNIVKLAPIRICLKMFGGSMTIEEFRNFTDSNKITNILEYLMIPISLQIEEINYDNSYNKNDYIPIDQDRVKKLEQKIKLMRTTPLLNHKNTLEHTMNIKINET